ncbi:MAG: GH3 auxin-responsive promoter family protein [Gemmata sp.]
MASTRFLQPLTNAPLVRKVADAVLLRYANHRTTQLDRMDVAAVQRRTLRRLVQKAKRTKFGRDHDFAGVASVEDYQARTRVREYEWFWTNYWKDAYPRIDNLTWPGHIPYYALSSGTTSGATKYIPVSKEMVASNKKAGFTTTALFRHANPGAKLFTGKFFFLGGTTDLRRQSDGSHAGDLSGIASRELLELLRPYTFPPAELALITNWEEKVQRFAELSAREPVTALSGIPAWMHTLFGRLKQVTGKRTIAEIWPELRLVIHGGTKFDAYRDLFKQEIGSERVKFCEVYPCSEGFIATEDPRHGHLRIVPDHGIFFEFVPVEDLGKESPARHTLANVETGVQYAVVLTTCAGVWSYMVGDTVAFERRDPPLIRFTGRTKYFLSAFGEHLISEEIERAVAHASAVCGVHPLDFHVGPVFSTVPGVAGHHLYLVEFAGGAPADLPRFAKEIDGELNRTNEDYGPHRVNDLAMRMPEVRVVRRGGFDEWMKARGKYGGQNKVPRMDNSGALTKDMLTWFTEHGFVGA